MKKTEDEGAEGANTEHRTPNARQKMRTPKRVKTEIAMAQIARKLCRDRQMLEGFLTSDL